MQPCRQSDCTAPALLVSKKIRAAAKDARTGADCRPREQKKWRGVFFAVVFWPQPHSWIGPVLPPVWGPGQSHNGIPPAQMRPGVLLRAGRLDPGSAPTKRGETANAAPHNGCPKKRGGGRKPPAAPPKNRPARGGDAPPRHQRHPATGQFGAPKPAKAPNRLPSDKPKSASTPRHQHQADAARNHPALRPPPPTTAATGYDVGWGVAENQPGELASGASRTTGSVSLRAPPAPTRLAPAAAGQPPWRGRGRGNASTTGNGTAGACNWGGDAQNRTAEQDGGPPSQGATACHTKAPASNGGLLLFQLKRNSFQAADPWAGCGHPENPWRQSGSPLCERKARRGVLENGHVRAIDARFGRTGGPGSARRRMVAVRFPKRGGLTIEQKRSVAGKKWVALVVNSVARRLLTCKRRSGDFYQRISRARLRADEGGRVAIDLGPN